MKKLDYRFFYYKTRAAYLNDVAYNRIPEDAIVFVEEGRYIITHGAEYKCSDDPSSPTTVIGDLLQMMFDRKQDKLTAGNNITIEGNVISATGTGGGSVDFSDLSDTQKSALERAIKEMLNESGNESLIEKIITKIIEQSNDDIDGTTLIEQIIEKIGDNVNINLTEEQLNDLKSQISSITYEQISQIDTFDPTNTEDLSSLITNLIESKGFINSIINELDVYKKSETYDRTTIDQKISTAAAGTTEENINNAIRTYLQNNASDIFNGYVTTEDLNGYAKTEDIPAQLQGSDSISVENNKIYVKASGLASIISSLSAEQKTALKNALGVSELSSVITYEELT